MNFFPLSSAHNVRLQCSLCVKNPQDFGRSARSAWLECRQRSTTTQQAKVPKDVEVDETRKPICVSTSRKHHHENRTKRNKEENTQTETLYLSVLVRVEKSTKRMQPQSGLSRSNVPRILLTPHSSQLAEKGPQRISRSSAGAACVRRLSSRSACEWQKS